MRYGRGESDLGAQRRDHTVCSVSRTCSEQRALDIGATSGKGQLHTLAKTRVKECVNQRTGRRACNLLYL